MKAKTNQSFFPGNQKLVAFLVFVLAFLVYINTLHHGFVLDDTMLITKNSFTTKGFGGLKEIFTNDTFKGYTDQYLVYGQRYRPLSLSIFAIIYQYAGANPLPYHLVNISFYAILCVLLYYTLNLIFKDYPTDKKNYFILSACLLFVLHPIHTEVVANIKSLDEILVLIFSIAALNLSLTGFDKKSWLFIFLSSITLFLGILSKENAIMFIAVIPLTLMFFRQANLKSIIKHGIPLLAVGIIYIIIRLKLIGFGIDKEPLELINNPFVKIEGSRWVYYSGIERFGSIMYSLLKYLKLLIIPYPLTSDYYPMYVGNVGVANLYIVLSILVHVILIVFCIKSIRSKNWNLLTYGIIFYFITIFIVSNIVFPIGTNLAERFAFMPSIGICLCIAYLLYSLKLKSKVGFYILGGLILTAYLSITLRRNQDWKSNDSLIIADINKSSKSVRMQNAYATMLINTAQRETDLKIKDGLLLQAILHEDTAITMHPTYINAYAMRGNAHYLRSNLDEAIANYKVVYKLNPTFPDNLNNLALSLRERASYHFNNNNYEKAIQDLNETYNLYQQDPIVAELYSKCFLKLGKKAEALHWLDIWKTLEPQNSNIEELKKSL